MRQEHSIDVVVVLLLLCTFSVAVMLVLMTGASAYGGVTEHMQENYDLRTGTAYIMEKVRHCGDDALVEVTEMPVDPEGDKGGSGAGTVPALAVTQTLEGARYSTYIYYCDGYIRELFTETGNFMEPDTGAKIMAAGGLELDDSREGLVKVTCVLEDGGRSSAFISTDRSGGGRDAA